MERKFLDFSLHMTECSREGKFHRNESSICGIFAPGNESAEERRVQIPGLVGRWSIYTHYCFYTLVKVIAKEHGVTRIMA